MLSRAMTSAQLRMLCANCGLSAQDGACCVLATRVVSDSDRAVAEVLAAWVAEPC